MSELRDNLGDIQLVGPGDGVIEVKVRVTNMHGGISMGITSTAARIEMTLQLMKDGQVADEVTMVGTASQDEGVKVFGVATSGYSGSDRLNQAAEKLGDYAATYFKDRTAGE